MKTKHRIGLLLVVAVIAVAGSQLVAGPKSDKSDKEGMQPKKRAYTPVLTVEQTMEGQADLMKTIKGGVLDGNWKEARHAAYVLAELSSTNQYHHDAKDYQTWAKDLSKDCLDLAKALKKKDKEASKELIQKAGQKCSACHDAYK